MGLLSGQQNTQKAITSLGQLRSSLTACKFMSQLKKTLNECHAFFLLFFFPLSHAAVRAASFRVQQLIRHVKELVQAVVVVVGCCGTVNCAGH